MKVSDDHVWYWHKHCEKQIESGLSMKTYAEKFDIEYKRFSNIRYRIVYKKYSSPETYKKILKQAKEFLASGEPIGRFSSSRNLNQRVISEMVTHLQYQERIEWLTKERKEPLEEPKMNFVQVANMRSSCIAASSMNSSSTSATGNGTSRCPTVWPNWISMGPATRRTGSTFSLPWKRATASFPKRT